MAEEHQDLFKIVTENYEIIAPAVAGVGASLLVSENKSWKSIAARVGTGLFISLTFTDSVIHYLQRDPEIYRTSIAGLLAMTGFEIVRMLSTLTPNSLVKLVREARGKSNDT